jgi:hypothetical protein
MKINSDFRDLLCEFNAAEVRYLVVGAYAVFLHAQPRYTKDLDVWVDATDDNAPRVFAALTKFGAELSQVSPADFARPGITFQMGIEPNRIDVLTEISSVAFADAWPSRLESTYGDQRLWVLGREHLLQNKRAVGRPQDLLDIEKIEHAKKP